jgi:hypothetical protein
MIQRGAPAITSATPCPYPGVKRDRGQRGARWTEEKERYGREGAVRREKERDGLDTPADRARMEGSYEHCLEEMRSSTDRGSAT